MLVKTANSVDIGHRIDRQFILNKKIEMKLNNYHMAFFNPCIMTSTSEHSVGLSTSGIGYKHSSTSSRDDCRNRSCPTSASYKPGSDSGSGFNGICRSVGSGTSSFTRNYRRDT